MGAPSSAAADSTSKSSLAGPVIPLDHDTYVVTVVLIRSRREDRLVGAPHEDVVDEVKQRLQEACEGDLGGAFLVTGVESMAGRAEADVNGELKEVA